MAPPFCSGAFLERHAAGSISSPSALHIQAELRDNNQHPIECLCCGPFAPLSSLLEGLDALHVNAKLAAACRQPQRSTCQSLSSQVALPISSCSTNDATTGGWTKKALFLCSAASLHGPPFEFSFSCHYLLLWSSFSLSSILILTQPSCPFAPPLLTFYTYLIYP